MAVTINTTTTTIRRMARMFVCSVLFLLLPPLSHSIETVFLDSPSGSSSSSSTAEFELDSDFYVGKCDPCIPRNQYRIQAIVHGTTNDVYWQQVQLAMEQASRDTGVELELTLYKDGMSMEEITASMAQKIRQSALPSNSRPQALIVTLPSVNVHQAVAQAIQDQMPVFGFHSGYEFAQALGVLGFVAQDESLAGRRVAEQLLELLPPLPSKTHEIVIFPFVDDPTNETEAIYRNNNNNNNQDDNNQDDNVIQVLFVNHKQDDPDVSARFRGLRVALLEASSGTIQTTQLVVDPHQVFETVQTLNDEVFLGCPYNAVVLGGESLVDIAVSAIQDLGCTDKMILASFGMSKEIVSAIVEGHLAFTAAPQHYLEAVFSVVTASMFVTTGKKLSLPQETKIYLSGPKLVTIDNLPTDYEETCREQGFPVCNPSNNGQPYQDALVTTNPDNTPACNGVGCLPRKTIRIGGVLHGVKTDSFWDPVFAAAYQAATDVGITLELERFERQESNNIVFDKMAGRIESLCNSGVDGIFVTIPGEQVSTGLATVARWQWHKRRTYNQ
jgi:ABC-type sugar transport system substrate-binding protein